VRASGRGVGRAAIAKRVLAALTVLPYDVAAARVYGQVRARLESAGRPLADADLQIAATALLHDLEMVTGNVKHFRRVPGLRISPALADARIRSSPNTSFPQRSCSYPPGSKTTSRVFDRLGAAVVE